MRFGPALRRLTFTTHVTTSVGWIGAVLVFLALAAIGLVSGDERTVLALVLLVTATVLGVYKPFGVTPYGRREQGRLQAVPSPPLAAERAGMSNRLAIALIAGGILLLLLMLAHLLSGTLHSH
jgi:hypothetical protein